MIDKKTLPTSTRTQSLPTTTSLASKMGSCPKYLLSSKVRIPLQNILHIIVSLLIARWSQAWPYIIGPRFYILTMWWFFLMKWHKLYLMDDDLKMLPCLNKKYCKMVNNVLQLRFANFFSLKNPRFNYVEQTLISIARVNLTTAWVIHYRLNPGVVIHYLKSKYIGESQDFKKSFWWSHPTSATKTVSISNKSL